MKKPPLAQDPIREAARNWERHGWGDVARPMAGDAVVGWSRALAERAERLILVLLGLAVLAVLASGTRSVGGPGRCCSGWPAC